MIASGGSRGEKSPNDTALLAAIRDMFETVDPMPSGLPERIRFALALRDLEAEVAHVRDTTDEAVVAARGAEESHTVTFDSDSLTIMIRVDANPDGTARVDGWLAPPRAHQVQMKLSDGSIVVSADERGRFLFPSVPRGVARLIVHPPGTGLSVSAFDDSSTAAKSVITPALTLLAGEWTHRNGVRWKLTAVPCGRATQATLPWHLVCFGRGWRISAGTKE